MMWIIIAIMAVAALGFLFRASARIRSGVYLKAFCREKTEDKVVYLTFDDGPVAESTAAVLDVLRSRGAAATFFIIGSNISGNEPLIRRILAEGHGVGIHSWSHAGTFPLYSVPRMAEDISRCRTALEALSGRKVDLFRPPFGVVNPLVAGAVKRCGLRTVGWSVRSFDTMHCGSPTWKEDVLDRIMRHVEPGAVILLHDRLPGAASLLSSLLDRLAAEGYRFDRRLPL